MAFGILYYWDVYYTEYEPRQSMSHCTRRVGDISLTSHIDPMTSERCMRSRQLARRSFQLSGPVSTETKREANTYSELRAIRAVYSPR